MEGDDAKRDSKLRMSKFVQEVTAVLTDQYYPVRGEPTALESVLDPVSSPDLVKHVR